MSASESQNQTGPLKVPYFYLSHARADDESSVHDFFTDLSSLIRFKAKLTGTQVAGRWNTSRQERDEGLRTSRVMIALLSPAYLRDEAALLEWKIFELRRRRALLAGHLSNRETLKRSIIPVCWSPCSGSMPVEIRQTPLFEGDVKSGPNVTGGVQSLASNQKAAFVNSLARYIIEVTGSFQLTPLEAIPDEVPNVFADREEPEMNSETTNAMPNKNPSHNITQNVTQKLYIDGAFVRSVAEQTKATAPKPSTQSEVKQSKSSCDERYSVFVVDDDKDLCKLIKALCDYGQQFKCETFQDPAALFDKVDTAWNQHRSAPDLFVIDLELTGMSMQGLTLIQKLTEELELPCAIIALSENLTGNDLLNIVGIGRVTGMLKPFNERELIQKMTHRAEIGRKLRLKQTIPISPDDESRKERPMFLSYSNQNKRIARSFTNSFEDETIDVFYAGYSIQGGENPPERVRASLATARVFVPLISDDYVNSAYCRAELSNALAYKADETRCPSLKIIPLLYDLSSSNKEDKLIAECLLENQGIIVRADRLADAFQKLLMRVQAYLRNSTS